MALLIRLLIPLAFLGLGYWSYTKVSVKTEAEPTPLPQPKKLETVVTPLVREDFQVILRSQGTVQPHNRTTLTPRVSGRIIRLSEQFESGAFFQKGDTLAELDPTDFLAQVSSTEARLARAEAALAQESARAEQARLDWADLGYTGEPTDLVLRKPQLKQAEADVKAAQAALSAAKRQLDRAEIRAPYTGRVLERLVGLGQSVSPGTRLGEIFSTDFAEVRLSLSPRELQHIDLPNDLADPPVPVTLTDAFASNDPASWQGFIVRTEGALDERSRKLFVIARINNPFISRDDTPPLRIGQPLRAVFQGKIIPSVFVIPREMERWPGEIVLIEPEVNRLRRRPIKPVWTDDEHLVVRDGLPEDWLLSTTRMSAYPNGGKVTIIPPHESIDASKPNLAEASPPGA